MTRPRDSGVIVAFAGSAMLDQPELVTHLRWRHDADVHRLEQRLGATDEVAVARENTLDR